LNSSGAYIQGIIPLLFVLLLIPVISQAQESEELLFGAGDITLDTTFSQLFSTAEEQGTVKIIVSLDVSFIPEGTFFESSAIEGQRELIKSAQEELLSGISGFMSPTESVPHSFKYIPSIAMTVDIATLEFLQTHPLVSRITEDTALFPALAQSIPIIGADQAWSYGYSGQGQTIAILDTGVENFHPMLSGKIVDEACYSTTSPPHDSTTLCPNGIGEQTGPGAAAPCSGICSHGTHVAGTAAGAEYFSGPVSYRGVATDSDIIAIQVFSKFDTRAQCDPLNRGWPTPCVKAFDSDILKGLEHVYDLRNTYDISSVNLSLGGDKFLSECDTVSRDYTNSINQLRSFEIATIVASGNDGYTDGISFPACISSAISVGATTDNDQVASFSNNADFLDLSAPGVDVRASVPGGGLGYKSGTSMATPHVAGAWAVMKSASPTASIQDVLDSLTRTGVDVVDTRSGSTGLTFKRIQLDSAVCDLVYGGTCPIGFVPVIDSTESDPTSSNPVTFSVNFGTPIDASTFSAADVTTSSGTVQNIQNSGDDQNFTFEVLDPTDGAALSVNIGAGLVEDPTSTPNAASNTFTINVDFGPSGFDITVNPDQLSMRKGESASSTITVNEFGGFSGTVTLHLIESSPQDISATFSFNPVTITSSTPSPTSIMTVTSIGDSGTYSVEVKGDSGAVTERNSAVISIVEVNECLIATAAFGSNMAPQVQLLREMRDNILLETSAGSSFMAGFNAFYYSFSPTVAQWERDNPVFKEMVRATITPLIASLSILNYVDIDSELEVIVYGTGIILLNISMYFLLPIFGIIRIKQFVKKERTISVK